MLLHILWDAIEALNTKIKVYRLPLKSKYIWKELLKWIMNIELIHVES